MTARGVGAALARAREAGHLLRARSAEAVQDALADVLDAWSEPDSPWQKALVEALPDAAGFSPAVVREGLARGLAPFTGAALRALLRSELGGGAAGFDATAVVLAGAIPMPTLLAVVAPLALRSPVLAKPSAHDPVTALLIARSLAERDPLLGACVEVVDVRGDDEASVAALCEADCVVANGSDAAVAALAARVQPHGAGASCPRRFVGYGHRFSMAILGPGATRGESLLRAAEGLALDIALWDQLGCLSPVSVHAVDPDPRAADRVAEALTEALARAETRWPRGRVDTAAAAAIARERSEAEMRAAAGRGPVTVHASSGTAWTVVREADAVLRPAPLHRFARVHPAVDVDGCLDALRADAAHLAAVAIAGFGAAGAPLAAELAGLGASRVCAPGTLQSPPLAWHRGNVGVLAPIARWTDIEL
jgi:hypothetical protein